MPILKDLDPALLMDIAAELQQRTFAAGEPIIRQGEEGHEFFVVESGIAVITDAKGCQARRRSGPAAALRPPPELRAPSKRPVALACSRAREPI